VTSIAILGPGGVGGFLAGALDRAGLPVTLVGREETIEQIVRDGLDVRSVHLEARWQAHPRAVTRLEDDVDVLIIATKATGLDAALDRVAGSPGIVIPLLNGLDHLAVLRERFGEDRVIPATIRVESTRTAPGVIEQTSPMLRIDLAADDVPGAGELPALQAGAGVPVHVGGPEAQVMWSKLSRLNALACATAASGLTLGAVRSDPQWRAALDSVIDETAAVAAAEGADVDAATVRAEIESVHDGLMSSMARDVDAGREPELDAIPGAVVRAGARHGIACPEIERLMALIAARVSR
jgi:2-dehydropantoate 2-reductase